MAPRIVMLLGRGVWTRGPDGWNHESFTGGAAGTAAAAARLAQILSEGSRGKRVVVFEPEEIAHQSVECPRVSRTVFASLAKVRSEFPVVESGLLGWGIEPPEPVQGGGFSSLIHSELTQGVIQARDACTDARSELVAAWSAYTAAAACIRNEQLVVGPKFVLMLLPEFTAVAVCIPGKRSFKAWVGPMTDRDWRAFSALIGDMDTRSSPSMGDGALRRGSIAVIAEGDPGHHCPQWDDIHRSGRVVAELNLDDLARGISRIPRTHPANLVEAFPRKRNLDPYLAGASCLCCLAMLALAPSVASQRRQLREDRDAIRTRTAALELRLAVLEKNREEIVRLRDMIPEAAEYPRSGMHETLQGLSAAIPDGLTLTSLLLRRNNGFELEAIVVGDGINPEGLRIAIEGCGLHPDVRGWVFDAAAGRLSVHGKIGAPRT